MLIIVGSRTVQSPVTRDISVVIITTKMGHAVPAKLALFIQRSVIYGVSEMVVPRNVKTNAFREHAANVAIVHQLM